MALGGGRKRSELQRKNCQVELYRCEKVQKVVNMSSIAITKMQEVQMLCLDAQKPKTFHCLQPIATKKMPIDTLLTPPPTPPHTHPRLKECRGRHAKATWSVGSGDIVLYQANKNILPKYLIPECFFLSAKKTRNANFLKNSAVWDTGFRKKIG